MLERREPDTAAPTPAATARAIGARPRPLRRLRPDLPRELSDAVDACLQTRPDRRPALEELGGAIESSLDGLAEHPPARRPLAAPAPRRGCRRRRAGRLARRRSRRPAPVGFGPVSPPPERPPAREKEPTISVLRNLESRIEGLVEGVFSRAFSSEVQPVELARKLAKEMDAHKTAGVARVYVPNEYTVFLSSKDRVKLEGYERSLEQELSGYLLEHARRRNYDLLTRPAVEFKTDERLRLGEFGIQTRLVKPPAREGEAPRARGRRGTRWSTRR